MPAPQINPETYITRTYQVTLELPGSSYGYFSVSNTGGSTLTGNNTWDITIEGSLSQVNTALSSLSFIPSADFTDSTINVNYIQRDNNDNSNPTAFATRLTKAFVLNVRNIHDEFSIVDLIQQYDEDTIKVWNVGSITDLRPDNVDANIQYTLTLTSNIDTAITSITNWTEQTPSTVWTFTGTKAQCNTELSSVEIIPKPGFTGSFMLTYQQNQDDDSIDHGQTFITFSVGTVHDEYSIDFTPVNYTEDTQLTLSNAIQITDLRPDNIDPSMTYKSTLVISEAGGALIDGWVKESGSIFTFTGTKAQCNTALSSLVITPPANLETFTLRYRHTDIDNNITTATSSPINFTATVVHDDVSLNTAQSYVEDTSSNWNLGSITDLRPDNIDPNIVYRLTISTTDGVIGSPWVDQGDDTYEYSGTKLQCNTELASVLFTPNPDLDVNFDFTLAIWDITNGSNLLDPVTPMTGTQTFNVTNVTQHGEFNITSTQNYSTNTMATWNVGSITDLRPDNVDANIQYTMTLSGVNGIVNGWTNADTSYVATEILTNPDTVNSWNFGQGLDINGAGTIMMVSSGHNPNWLSGSRDQGAVYYYTYSGSWSSATEITPEGDLVFGVDQYGNDVSMSSDGNWLAVTGTKGGTYDPATYIHSNTGGTWPLDQTITGYTMKISKDGTTMAGPDGAAGNNFAVYTESAGTWSLEDSWTVTTITSFDISSDGNTVVIISNYGDVLTYKRTGTTWALIDTIVSTFSYSATISGDGQTMAFLANDDDEVYIYSRIVDDWSLDYTITGITTTTGPLVLSEEGSVLAIDNHGIYYLTTNAQVAKDIIPMSPGFPAILSKGVFTDDASQLFYGDPDENLGDGSVFSTSLPTGFSYTFSGTKAQCNTELLDVEIDTLRSDTSSFDVTYTQLQVTDNIGQGSTTITVTNV